MSKREELTIQDIDRAIDKFCREAAPVFENFAKRMADLAACDTDDQDIAEIEKAIEAFLRRVRVVDVDAI